ncbi:MAG: hypothetical protein ACRCSF_06540 [Mycobacteriaceae bacterium]
MSGGMLTTGSIDAGIVNGSILDSAALSSETTSGSQLIPCLRGAFIALALLGLLVLIVLV